MSERSTAANGRRLLVAQVAASFGLAAGGTSGSLLAAAMMRSEAAGALPVGALALGAAIAARAITRIMSRRGRRAGLMAGYQWALAGAIEVLIALVIDSLPMLLIGSGLLGAGTAAVMLTRYAIADLAPPEARGQAVSRSLFATTAGAVMGPLLLRPAAILATPVGLPSEAGLYVVALGAFGLAAGLLHRGPEPVTVDAEPTLDGDDQRRPPRRAGANPSPTGDRLALVILGTANAVMVSVMAMAVVHLHAHGYDLATIGVMVSVHVAAMFAFSPIIGVVCDRIGARALATIGTGLLATIGVVGAAVDSVRLMHMAGVMFALGVAWNVQVVSGTSLLTLAAPGRDQRAAEGRAELAMGLAAGIGTLLAAAPLASLGGFRLLCAAVAVVSAASGARLLRSTSTRRREAVPIGGAG
jgi:MFS family permease